MANTAHAATETLPGVRRLQAAIDTVVAKVQPEQIVLFGSAVRGTMTEASDLDLLVVEPRQAGTCRTAHEHWTCPDTGDELDVVLMSRTVAEEGRHSATCIQGIALEEGRTIYVRPGTTPVATGPGRIRTGSEMVKSTLYQPDHAEEFVEQARERWDTAQTTPRAVFKCELLQASMERALKALITAQGQRVAHRHDLNALRDQAESAGETIAAKRDNAAPDRLTKYAGQWQYAVPSDIDPQAGWNANRTSGEQVLRHAERRVPKLAKRNEGETSKCTAAAARRLKPAVGNRPSASSPTGEQDYGDRKKVERRCPKAERAATHRKLRAQGVLNRTADGPPASIIGSP